MRAREASSLTVFRSGERVGELRRTERGAVFAYDASLSAGDRGIAFNMPWRELPYEVSGDNLHPFFAGLLPEGARLAAIVRRVHSSKDDLYSLFAEAGGDTIGDISVGFDGSLPRSLPSLDAKEISRTDLRALFQRATDPVGTFRDASIPGVQDKLSASMMSLPVRAKDAAGYIIKLNPIDLPTLARNEHFFLGVAKQAGIRVNSASIIRDASDEEALLVERFDRYRTDSSIGMAHVEDACQFLDKYPNDKYRISCRQVCEGVARFASSQIVEALRFIQQYTFSYVIGNGDMHAKNVSLWRNPTTQIVELTPAYDLLSTVPYPGLDQHMAMKLDGRDDDFSSTHFVEFGRRWGVSERSIRSCLDKIATATLAASDRIAEIGLDAKAAERLRSELTRRAGRIKN